MKPDSFVTPFPGHLIRQHNLPSGLMFHQFFHQFYVDLFNIFFASCRFAQQFMDQKRPDSLIYTSETLFQDHYSTCFILFGFYAVFSAFFHFLFHKCPHCPHLLHRIRHMWNNSWINLSFQVWDHMISKTIPCIMVFQIRLIGTIVYIIFF